MLAFSSLLHGALFLYLCITLHNKVKGNCSHYLVLFYDSNQYYYLMPFDSSVFSKLEPGKGYWIVGYHPNGSCYSTITFTGKPVTLLNITLNKGWNLIGSTCYKVFKKSLVATCDLAGIYGFNETIHYYQKTNWLEPGKGYWVAATNDNCTLSLFSKCYDTDGGINPEIQGRVIEKSEIYKDKCQNNTILLEYFCSESGVSKKIINCEEYCRNTYGNATLGFCNEGACVCTKNEKNRDKYSDKTVFLVSDEDWRNVLSLVPVAVWTSKEDSKWCQKGYGTPENVCVYPLLIAHYEPPLESISEGFGFMCRIIFLEPYILLPVASTEFINISYPESITTGDFSINACLQLPFTTYVYNISCWSVGAYSSYIIPQVESIEINTEINNTCIDYPFTFMGTPETFDADSIVHFLQHYLPEKLLIVGNLSQEFLDILVAEPPFGGGIEEEKIQQLSIEEYTNYWKYFKTVIYTENNYTTALLASVYSSLINAPLIIQGYNEEYIDLDDKFTICIGNVNSNFCDRVYTFQELLEEIINTVEKVDGRKPDKIILTNPEDVNIFYLESFQPEKSLTRITKLYGEHSLASPILASAKHEILLETTSNEIEEIKELITAFVNNLGNVEYLTIIGSPLSIPMAYILPTNLSDPVYLPADIFKYSDIDEDQFQDLSVGRIFALTITDVSSYIARDLFYDQTINQTNKILIGGQDCCNLDMYRCLEYPLSIIGYDAAYYDACENVPSIENGFILLESGHGNVNLIPGITSSSLPWLNNLFMVAMSCATCDFYEAGEYLPYTLGTKKDLFCAHVIRKGGIGYIGAVDLTGYHPFHLLFHFLSANLTIGEAFKLTNIASCTYPYFPFSSNYHNYILIGDPTIKLKFPHKLPGQEVIKLDESVYKWVFYILKVNNTFFSTSFTGCPCNNCPWNNIATNDFIGGIRIKTETENEDLQVITPPIASQTSLVKINEIENDKTYTWLWYRARPFYTNVSDQEFTPFTLYLVNISDLVEPITEEPIFMGRNDNSSYSCPPLEGYVFVEEDDENNVCVYCLQEEDKVFIDYINGNCYYCPNEYPYYYEVMNKCLKEQFY